MAPPRKVSAVANPSTSARPGTRAQRGGGLRRENVRDENIPGEGSSVAFVPPVVPEEWRGIKNIEECLWTTTDVLGRPSRIVNVRRLRDCETAWKKCFNLYPIGEVIDRHPAGTYKLAIPDPTERVCTPADEGGTPYVMVYKALFDKMKIQFPFSSFQLEVLQALDIAPSQLHVNGWGFMQAFEVFCWGQDWYCSSSLFRSIFHPFLSVKSKKDWISFRQNDNPVLFSAFSDPFKDWKDEYFKIVPRNEDVAFWKGENGANMIPLYWKRAPYTATPPSQADLFGCLTDEDEATFRKLCAFVGNWGVPINCHDVIDSFSGNNRESFLGEF